MSTRPNYYVVQGTGIQNWWEHEYLVAKASVATELTENQCLWSILYYDVSIYYGGAWHQRAASSVNGYWKNGHCVLEVDSPVYDPNNDAEKVQVAVKAKYVDMNGEHYARVKGGVVKTSVLTP